MNKILTQLNGNKIEVGCEEDLINLSKEELAKVNKVMDIHYENFGNEFLFIELRQIVKDKLASL